MPKSHRQLLYAAKEYNRRRVTRHYGLKHAISRDSYEPCRRCKRIIELVNTTRPGKLVNRDNARRLDHCWRSPCHVASFFGLTKPYQGMHVQAVAYVLREIGLRDTSQRIDALERLIHVHQRLNRAPITGKQLLTHALKLDI